MRHRLLRGATFRRARRPRVVYLDRVVWFDLSTSVLVLGEIGYGKAPAE
jgi:hypothetical protein